MKMKLYYGALALLWLLSSCTPSNNVTDSYETVGTCRNGDCKKCKHELDSIVKAAVKEAMQCE